MRVRPAFRRAFVLAAHDLFVVLRERIGRRRVGDDGLHAQAVEAEVEHDIDVRHEIGVEVGEGAADVVILFPARLCELLKLRHDDVEASHPAHGVTEAVVDLFPAVQTHDDIVHLAVGELDDIVVDKHTVGGEGETEVFAALLFEGACVCGDFFHHIEIHERLTAEKVYLEVVAGAGISDEEIYCSLPHLERHEGSLAVITPLACETVIAVQVAGVGDMQAKRLDDSRA